MYNTIDRLNQEMDAADLQRELDDVTVNFDEIGMEELLFENRNIRYFIEDPYI
jgi:hypothetical protein